MKGIMKMRGLALLQVGLMLGASISNASFTEAEKTDIQKYWKSPSRYHVGPIDKARGPYAVRLTVEGSKWLYFYTKRIPVSARGSLAPALTVPQPSFAPEAPKKVEPKQPIPTKTPGAKVEKPKASGFPNGRSPSAPPPFKSLPSTEDFPLEAPPMTAPMPKRAPVEPPKVEPKKNPKGSLKPVAKPQGLTESVPQTEVATNDAESWIDAQVAYDRYLAAVEAQTRNDLANGTTSPTIPSVPKPGKAPKGLIERYGEPPKFANVVQPKVHVVQFEDDTIALEDNTDMRPRYISYRFPEGVMSVGTPVRMMTPGEFDELVASAQFSESEAKVFKIVSQLEGGFDSVNTYDTGFVSVGFIQFAALKSGSGSLGHTLLAYKTQDPENFDADFRRFGLDVTPDGFLVALDVASGEEKVGTDANAQIIADKRLIAVFQRAGRKTPYRAAQLRVAKQMYYPADEPIEINTPNGVLSGKLCDVIKSEAGLATFLDMKVNTGNVNPLADALEIIAREQNITDFKALAEYEHAVINCVWYRDNYCFCPELSQPKPCEEVPKSLMSRYGSRFGRRPRGR